MPASRLSFGYSRLVDIPQKELQHGLVSYCDYQAWLNAQPSPKSNCAGELAAEWSLGQCSSILRLQKKAPKKFQSFSSLAKVAVKMLVVVGSMLDKHWGRCIHQAIIICRVMSTSVFKPSYVSPFQRRGIGGTEWQRSDMAAKILLVGLFLGLLVCFFTTNSMSRTTIPTTTVVQPKLCFRGILPSIFSGRPSWQACPKGE